MRLVWIIFSLVFFGLLACEESFAENVNAVSKIDSYYEQGFTIPISYDPIDWENSQYYPLVELNPPLLLSQQDYVDGFENVLCKDNLVLIFNPSTSYPTCVTETTYEKLLERGWKEVYFEPAWTKVYFEIGLNQIYFEPKREIPSLDLNKDILANLFSKLDHSTILLIEEEFQIRDKLYLSSDCPVCFDKVDHDVLLDILDWLNPDSCDGNVIYEGCLVQLDGSKSYDPDGKNEITEYPWYRTKSPGNDFSRSEIIDIWNNNRISALRTHFDSFNEYFLYFDSLKFCCFGEIDFVKDGSTLTFFTPDVPYDIGLSFQLTVLDPDAGRFSEPDNITIRIRNT